MILIRSRIQAEVEAEVTNTQYGFRPAKAWRMPSSSSEECKTLQKKNRQPLYMTLLDWEKAFDKMDHKCLGDALERLGIDKGVIETLNDGYTKAKFS